LDVFTQKLGNFYFLLGLFKWEPIEIPLLLSFTERTLHGNLILTMEKIAQPPKPV
jgi:hypothetical protein